MEEPSFLYFSSVAVSFVAFFFNGTREYQVEYPACQSTGFRSDLFGTFLVGTFVVPFLRYLFGAFLVGNFWYLFGAFLVPSIPSVSINGVS